MGINSIYYVTLFSIAHYSNAVPWIIPVVNTKQLFITALYTDNDSIEIDHILPINSIVSSSMS